MATSFKLDPHEYLTLAPGSQRAENELFLEGFAIAAWKPLMLVMNRQRVYVVLSGQNKWLSITRSFSRLPATYLPHPPPSSTATHPLSGIQPGFLKDRLPDLHLGKRSRLDVSAARGQQEKTALKRLHIHF